MDLKETSEKLEDKREKKMSGPRKDSREAEEGYEVGREGEKEASEARRD